MSLHPTLSEECIQYSVKKFFYDNLKTIDGVPIYFSYVFMTPQNSSTGVDHPTWVKFHLDGVGYAEGMGLAKVNAYVFSRGNATTPAGKLLAQTRDKLIAHLVNVTAGGNGIKAIPLLDLNNVRYSSMVVTFGQPTDEEVADDKTLYRLIPIRLRFPTI